MLQIRDLNSGTFGFVELALDKTTGQQVAVKFIERGDKVLSCTALCCALWILCPTPDQAPLEPDGRLLSTLSRVD